MKFSHIADCHIGSWREEKMNNLSTQAFLKAMGISMEKQVDFILIAGDIFNTSLPAIEKLKAATKKLKEVQEKEIPVYIIPGSHDFSATGKTMLDVLENAGLMINVMKGAVTEQNKIQLKFTQDKKTGAKITGVLGRKGSLERKYYEAIDPTNIEQESGFKIFLFHSAIAELKPKELEKMEAQPISYLPKDCDYYAGGHVHIVKHTSLDGYKNIVYPGPLFPNSFTELEKLKHGGFYLYDNGALQYIPIIIHPVKSIAIEAKQESAAAINARLRKEIETIPAKDAIITIRISGELSEGKIADIDFKAAKEFLEQQGTFFVIKSCTQLKTKEMEHMRIQGENTAEIEEKVVQEHSGQFQSEFLSKELQEKWTEQLIKMLNTEKEEGERIIDFENRVRKEVSIVLEVEL